MGNSEIVGVYWICMSGTGNEADGYLVLLVSLSAVRHSHLS